MWNPLKLAAESFLQFSQLTIFNAADSIIFAPLAVLCCFFG